MEGDLRWLRTFYQRGLRELQLTWAVSNQVVERGGDYIRAVAKLDDRLIILIDLARVLAQELREAPAAGA